MPGVRALALLACVLACRAPASPPASRDLAPLLAVRSEPFRGSPLSGPLDPASLPDDPQDWLAVDLSIDLLLHAPYEALDSVERRAVRVARDDLAAPFRPMGHDALGIRVGSGAPAEELLRRARAGEMGPVYEICRGRTALAPGMTLCLLLAPAESPPAIPAHADLPSPQQVAEVEIHLPPGSLPDGAPVPLRLALARRLAASDPDAPPPAAAAAPDRSRLLVDLGPREGPSETVALVVPLRRREFRGSALLLTARLRPSPAGEGALHATAVAAAREDATRAATAVGASRTGPAQEPSGDLGLVLAALEQPENARVALFFLAERANAPLAWEVALTGHALLVERLGRAVRDEPLPESADREELGWRLEQLAWRLLNALRDDDDLELPVEALLLLHAGEVGRSSSRLLDLLGEATSVEDLQARLIAANLAHLHDRAPASRVRAFDWLAARGRAPPGFDPLGGPAERRDTLRRSEEGGSP